MEWKKWLPCITMAAGVPLVVDEVLRQKASECMVMVVTDTYGLSRSITEYAATLQPEELKVWLYSDTAELVQHIALNRYKGTFLVYICSDDSFYRSTRSNFVTGLFYRCSAVFQYKPVDIIGSNAALDERKRAAVDKPA